MQKQKYMRVDKEDVKTEKQIRELAEKIFFAKKRQRRASGHPLKMATS